MNIITFQSRPEEDRVSQAQARDLELSVTRISTELTTGMLSRLVLLTPTQDGAASLHLPAGTASPNLLFPGDLWHYGGALKFYTGSVTKTLAFTEDAMTLADGSTAVTQSADTNTTTVATTAFVLGQAATASPIMDGTATVGTSTRFARQDHVHPTDTTRAALTGATFTGGITAPTVTGTTSISAPSINATTALTQDGTPVSLSGHTHTSSNITDFSTAADSRISAQKGVASGLATLDSNAKVPISQLPNSIMEYQGTWNATTNTPTLANGTGNTGDVYRVTVAGTRNLGSGNIEFGVGDYAIYNGSTWEKADTTDAVASVNGSTGVVLLTLPSTTSRSPNSFFTSYDSGTGLFAQSTIADADIVGALSNITSLTLSSALSGFSSLQFGSAAAGTTRNFTVAAKTDGTVGNSIRIYPGHSGGGTDLAGAALYLRGGQGTGAGAPGDVVVETYTSGTTGSGSQSAATRMTVDGSTGNVSINQGLTVSGKTTLPAATTSLMPLVIPSGTAPTTGLTSGGIWNVSGVLYLYTGSLTKTIAYTDSLMALASGSTATTQTAADNSTKVATTAYVDGYRGSATPLMNSGATGVVGTSNNWARENHVHPSDTSRAALTGAAFTGNVTISKDTEAFRVSSASGSGVVKVYTTSGGGLEVLNGAPLILWSGDTGAQMIKLFGSTGAATFSGTVTLPASTATPALTPLVIGSGADPSTLTSGGLWNSGGMLKFYNGSVTRTLPQNKAVTASTYLTGYSESTGTFSTDTLTTADITGLQSYVVGQQKGGFTVTIGNGVDLIPVGYAGPMVMVPYACTINSIYIAHNQTGTTNRTINITIYKSTRSQYPATLVQVGTAIMDGTTEDQSGTVDATNFTFAANDIVRFYVNSNGNAYRVAIGVFVTRTA